MMDVVVVSADALVDLPILPDHEGTVLHPPPFCFPWAAITQSGQRKIVPGRVGSKTMTKGPSLSLQPPHSTRRGGSWRHRPLEDLLRRRGALHLARFLRLALRHVALDGRPLFSPRPPT